MPIPPARPPQLIGRVFRGSRAVRTGLPTQKQLRSSAWVRLRQDVYADATLPLTHRVMISAVGATLPAGAGFTGRSAAVLWGVREIAGVDDPVEVVLPRGHRWNAGADVRTSQVLPGHELVRRGLWLCATRVDASVALIRRGEADEATVLLDRLCVAGMVRLDDVRGAVAALPRCRGSAQARWVVDQADGMAESPQETRVRLLLSRAGLPAPVAQFRVFDQDGFVARVDFAYPELKIAIEYDGLWHGERQAFLSDRRRLNRLVAAGWVVLHVTAEEMKRPERLAARVQALRAERLAMINAR